MRTLKEAKDYVETALEQTRTKPLTRLKIELIKGMRRAYHQGVEDGRDELLGRLADMEAEAKEDAKTIASLRKLVEAYRSVDTPERIAELEELLEAYRKVLVASIRGEL